MNLLRRRLTIAASALFPMLLGGCQVNQHKGADSNNVDIGTPFGSLHVKSDEPGAVAQTGLTPYPGAVPVHKRGDSDQGAADVSMNFGSFKLGVHAAEFFTADPQNKVLAFYRKDLGRYGTVIACHGQHGAGEPTRTVAGLSCDSNGSGASNNEVELRAGSELHQHIVSLNAKDGGTRIGLVALDLPSGSEDHSGGDRE